MLGSRFMDEPQGRNIILAVRCLSQLGISSSHAIYWSYLTARAQRLHLRTDSLEELAVARLVALCRVQNVQDITPILTIAIGGE